MKFAAACYTIAQQFAG